MNDGKVLEVEVATALLVHQNYQGSHFQRLYDATSSGNGKGHRNAGDFYWLIPKACVLIECKSTDVGASLLKLIMSSKTGKNQIPRHKLWHRSGHPSVYIYADLRADIVIAYCGKSVVRAVNSKDESLYELISVKSMAGISLLIDEVFKRVTKEA